MRDIRKEFGQLVREKNYHSTNDFAEANGIDCANLNTNLKGKFKLSIDRAFTIANGLAMPIEDVLEMFYPEEMEKNRRKCLK